MNKNIFLQFLPFITLPIAILSVQPYTTYEFGNTTIFWVIQFFILATVVVGIRLFYDPKQNRSMLSVFIYLFYMAFSFLHGTLAAEVYWDWKALISNTMSLLMPLIAFLATNVVISQILLYKYFKYVLPTFFLFMAFIAPSAWGYYLYPAALMAFFIPVLKLRYSILLVVLAIISASALGARSNVIKFSVPFIILIYYYFSQFFNFHTLKLVRVTFFVAPVLLFLLAINGIFNPFAMHEYVEGEYTSQAVVDGEVMEEDMAADTRTFLYHEVLTTAKKYNSWWIGRSPARGNETQWFGSWMEKMYGKNERYRNEASMLNVFTWTGLIGVIIYSLIFWQASYLGIYKSKNNFAKMLGLYVSFRWLFAWVEDVNNFDLNYFVLWFIVGMCMSESFRNLTNEEVKIWAMGTFDKRYRFYFKKNSSENE